MIAPISSPAASAANPTCAGGGLPIASRVPPTYGEPGAGHLVNTTLIAPGYAVEVFSLTNMAPGDLVGWNWEGDTNIANLDHVTLYLGNGLLASHSASCQDVSANTWYQGSESKAVRHLVHILDAPTMTSSIVGKNLILSWGTNWAGYNLYTATNPGPGATWTKLAKAPAIIGGTCRMTNQMSATGNAFYRLLLQ